MTEDEKKIILALRDKQSALKPKEIPFIDNLAEQVAVRPALRLSPDRLRWLTAIHSRLVKEGIL